MDDRISELRKEAKELLLRLDSLAQEESLHEERERVEEDLRELREERKVSEEVLLRPAAFELL